MGPGLLRLATMTVAMATTAIALGLTTYYLLEPSPYRRVASIDPAVSPADLLSQLKTNRMVPGRYGPFNIVGSNTVQRVDVDSGVVGSIAKSELVTRLFVHSRTAYSSSPVIVPLTIELRKFPDPLQARLALLGMMLEGERLGSISNPIRGHMYTSNGPPEIYRWVDGVWLGKLEAYDRGFMSLLLSWVPYVDIEGDPAKLESNPTLGPGQLFLLPALFLVAAAGVWPLAASRALKIRPRQNLQALSVDELIANLEALNGQDRSWRVTRSGTTDFLAEWKVVDKSWQGLFGRAGLSRAKSLRLRLQTSSATVKVVEQRYVVAIEGKWSGDAVVSIHRRRSFSLDLVKWPRLPAGSASPSTQIVSEGRSGGYDVSMIKRTVADTVLRAGWSYQPAMLMRWS